MPSAGTGSFTVTPCECGRGTVVYLSDGRRFCTDAADVFRARYGYPPAGLA